MRPLVIVESPYKGDLEGNIRYARLCVKDSIMRGESPFASHLLYTQDEILDDTIESERELGINAGLAWGSVADYVVFYVDLGMSEGMSYALDVHCKENRDVIYRKIRRESEDYLSIQTTTKPPSLKEKSSDLKARQERMDFLTTRPCRPRLELVTTLESALPSAG